MTRVLVTAGMAVALIFFVAFVASRLMRARSRNFGVNGYRIIDATGRRVRVKHQ